MLRAVTALSLVCIAPVAAIGQAPNLQYMDLVLKAVPDGPVARVNGQMIPAADFRDLYVSELTGFARANPGTPISDEIRVAVSFRMMRMLIQRTVLHQTALSRELTVSEEDVEEAWGRELGKLQQALGREGEALPNEEEVLELAGTTRPEALEELREALLVEEARKAIVEEAGVDVTDEEVAQWYEVHKDELRRPDICHLKQVFVRLPGQRAVGIEFMAQARERAETALKRIRSGESFEKVAKDLSDHPESIRGKGGDIGQGPVASLPEPLQEVVYSLQPGEVSGVVETTAGFYITKLLDFLPGAELTFEQSAGRIRTMLLHQKGAAAVREFCAQATNNEADIQVYLDLEKQLATRPELLKQLSLELAELPDPAQPSSAEGSDSP